LAKLTPRDIIPPQLWRLVILFPLQQRVQILNAPRPTLDDILLRRGTCGIRRNWVMASTIRTWKHFRSEATDFAYNKWETLGDNVAGNFVQKCNN